VTGDHDAVSRFLDTDASLLNAKGGPRAWEPLLYLCYSCLLREEAYRPRLLETARLLIDRGADVNAAWKNKDFDDCPESCLYGATGLNDCPALAEMLLAAGANPNDDESMYHSTELPTWDCLELLMQYGGSIRLHNALGHLLDREEPAWLRMMLSYVKDPTQIPPILPFALRRGRSAECCQILIDSGMDLNAPDPGQGGLTPFQAATRLGRTDVTALLEAAGADTTLTAADRVVGRLARGETVPPADITPEVIAALDAEKPTPTFAVLAERGQDIALEALLTAGADPNVSDGNGWTGLHHAALNGRLSTVRILLRGGADPAIFDGVHKAQAIGFACHASAHRTSPPADTYVQIVAELLDAGSTLPKTAWGSPEVQALLVARGATAAV
jgi:ankyrin repeat protein